METINTKDIKNFTGLYKETSKVFNNYNDIIINVYFKNSFHVVIEFFSADGSIKNYINIHDNYFKINSGEEKHSNNKFFPTYFDFDFDNEETFYFENNRGKKKFIEYIKNFLIEKFELPYFYFKFNTSNTFYISKNKNTII